MKDLKLILILILLTAGILPAASQTRSNSSLAFAYYNDGEWAKAAPLFLEIYETSHAKPYLTYYTRCLVELKEYEDALRALKKAARETRDITLYLDQAYLYELTNDRKKAEEYYQKPFSEFPQDLAAIRNLGNSYITYQKLDEAQRVYEIGRSLLKQPDEFRMEMGTLFRLQNRFDDMLNEFLALLLVQPQQLLSVQNYLLSALSTDIDQNLLEQTESRTLDFIRQFPGYSVYPELLVWVYSQQNRFDLAVDQAIALDLRSREMGDRTLRLARQARLAGDYASAIRAYEFLSTLEKPPVQVTIELCQSKFDLAKNLANQNENDYQRVYDFYAQSLNLLTEDHYRAMLFRDMAAIRFYYLKDPIAGLSLADSALALAVRNPQLTTECLMDKADFLMAGNDPWQATLLYARIDKENKDTPAGSLAKLKKAQAAFFSNDFSWALSQLDVLKTSTSKFIANDAFELALLIRENQSAEDSTSTGLKYLASARYLLFRKMQHECISLIDSLLDTREHELIHDDLLFIKAEQLIAENKLSEALQVFNLVFSGYGDGIWGHKALFRIGEIEIRQGNHDAAREAFTTLIADFPNSFYNLDARNYLRELRNEN